MNETIIYHITPLRDWKNALETGKYTTDSLGKEGFIHASTHEQVAGTANYLFRGQTGLVLLELDVNRIAAEIKYELVPNGLSFPHIYGEINLDAVLRVLEFQPDADGWFQFPGNMSA